MKDLATLLEDIQKKKGKKPAEFEELFLDSQCKSTTLAGLDAFVNLQVLSASNIGLTSLEGFPKLPKLQKLVLADNRVSGGLQSLVDAGIPDLKELDLSGNRIARLDALAPLKSLKLSSLHLFGCPIESVPDYNQKVFKMLDELEYLDSIDREGREHEADDEEEEEDYEEEGAEEQEGAGGEGEEAGEDDDEDEELEGEEFEGEIPEYAALVGEAPLDDDEEEYEGEDDEDEEEEDLDDEGEEEEEEEQAPAKGGQKRKREAGDEGDA